MKMKILDIKKTILAGLAVVLMISALLSAESSFAALKTYTSKGNALKPYRTKDYKPVNNIRYTPLRVKSFYDSYDFFFPKKYWPLCCVRRPKEMAFAGQWW